ncbi:hypothetical protein PC116_g1770 [Phytophthora cactorum]|uniref:Uncharacterized protein n=1 Tax=Phytophthora cactorum TaxID=29920 RepID=A0A8T1EK71_9STRA|nr:hypothetical protein Pcac1_g16170 [Phytophthora cactorum]KAG2935174.1 hypothetical protein PC114_g682 [Phytophthora cactorum]KAG2955246.1 hypothetical protein PC117_g556 [Phytophthora cactorum]KAG3034404.1 hypothetical protein PC120_g1455 [Phytophthora cactorum]KAG3040817.1 hypothetical protein PC119_g1232 [Phytophthora cactorum]
MSVGSLPCERLTVFGAQASNAIKVNLFGVALHRRLVVKKTVQ